MPYRASRRSCSLAAYRAPPERAQRRKLGCAPVLSILRRGARAGRRRCHDRHEQREEPAREAALKLAALTRLAVDDEVERERAREAAGLDGEATARYDRRALIGFSVAARRAGVIVAIAVTTRSSAVTPTNVTRS